MSDGSLFNVRSGEDTTRAKLLVERMKFNIKDPFVQRINPENYKDWATPSEVLAAMAIALEEINAESNGPSYSVFSINIVYAD